MSLRYTIEEVSKNGAVDRRSESYDKTEIVIGRGAGSDIILESSYVSLKHAQFTVSDAALSVEDLGSLSGVKVNGRIVARQQLKAGDEVTIGDVHFRVAKDGPWELIEKRSPNASVDAGERVKADLDRLTLSNRMPSFLTVTAIISALVVIVWFVLPMQGIHKSSWDSGPISNRHAAFGQNCETCHRAPFEKVGDDACLSCHRMGDHAKLLPASHSSQGPCTSCHMEHEGDHGLIVNKSQTCTNCHSNIKSRAAQATTANVASFASHPEFSVSIPLPSPAEGVSTVRLSDRSNLSDNSNVKLNHELHLKGPIRSRTGTQMLTCRSCHELTADQKSIKPINFKEHCQSCHSLGFDSRMEGREVPHGNSPDEIYNFLYAEYAKLYLASKSDAQTQEKFNMRAKPGENTAADQTPDADSVTQAFVERESRNAEEMLFTKTACQLCHSVERRSDTDPAQLKQASMSLFKVLPPRIPNQWMKQARFSHGAHDAVQCESCHSGVKASKDTKDVLLPGIQTCKNCHGDPSNKTLVRSDCIMCHSFHDKLPLEAVRQQKIEDLLKIGKGQGLS